MPQSEDFNRRQFLSRLGAGALVGAAGLGARQAEAAGEPWTPAPLIYNPNILIIMVDQMRQPVWLSKNQIGTLGQTVLPNIVGRIQNKAYNFSQYYACANNCTPSRSTILTGLYAPQTAIYNTDDTGAGPPLNTAYPTWATAIPQINKAYGGNMWWFGKWHLSLARSANPLLPYGFNTRTYPGGVPPYNPSPNGAANEGTVGGMSDGAEWANDLQIADDFQGWIEGQAPTTGAPKTPWCATVSLINPHDICFAPAFFEPGPTPWVPPAGIPVPPVWFPPPPGTPPSFYTGDPSPWNYEDLNTVKSKPTLQYALLEHENATVGQVTNWVLFLNQYFWLQNWVDKAVGAVLDALANSAFADNTIIIFLSDHGEYAGSHGLHTKGWAAYDEGIRVPLSVQFPKQTGSIAMGQMCSAVDFFGLACDLVSKGLGIWKKDYPNLTTRQSIWNFLRTNSSETRVAPAPVSLPYILSTFDELAASDATTFAHVVCMRTKQDAAAGQIGGKLCYYYNWSKCTTYPNTLTPQGEFYDYNPAGANNTHELGNDFTNPASQVTIANYTQVLGTWGPPGTGLVGSELNRPLTGNGTNGAPLSQALATAQQTFYNFAFGNGTCKT